MLKIQTNLLHKSYKLTNVSQKKKKEISFKHSLYCLSDNNYIHDTSICRFFVVQLIVVLVFFICLLVIWLDLY